MRLAALNTVSCLFFLPKLDSEVWDILIQFLAPHTEDIASPSDVFGTIDHANEERLHPHFRCAWLRASESDLLPQDVERHERMEAGCGKNREFLTYLCRHRTFSRPVRFCVEAILENSELSDLGKVG